MEFNNMDAIHRQISSRGTPSVLFFASTAFICIIGTVQSRELDNLARKSIVFDIKTPKVFYCPQEKPTGLDKMIVKAQPLEKLCEFLGKSKPTGRTSDCYKDVDETDFACEEKRRFMIKLDLLSEPNLYKAIDNLRNTLAKKSTKKTPVKSTY